MARGLQCLVHQLLICKEVRKGSRKVVVNHDQMVMPFAGHENTNCKRAKLETGVSSRDEGTLGADSATTSVDVKLCSAKWTLT